MLASGNTDIELNIKESLLMDRERERPRLNKQIKSFQLSLSGGRYWEVAAIQRFTTNMGKRLGLKVIGRYREVAAIRRWLHLEVRLYVFNCIFFRYLTVLLYFSSQFVAAYLLISICR